MKTTQYLTMVTLGAIFGPIKLFWFRFLKFIQDERMKFIVGFTSERFSHAAFYVNGRKDIRVAKSFPELEMLAKHFCKQYNLRMVSSFMLLQMWCSRRLIKFSSQDVRIEIVTYWNF